MDEAESRSSWTFLTNHAHVLVCIAEEPDVRGRDIADRVGITERSAQAIVADLVADGYPLEHDHTVGELLVTLGRLRPPRTRRS